MRLAIKISTQEEIAKLLEHAERELIPTLALQAFAAIRAEELKRLSELPLRCIEDHGLRTFTVLCRTLSLVLRFSLDSILFQFFTLAFTKISEAE